ncbi:MAG: glucoamylase family protein, partial [Pyrinomonadaceae bacterium]
MGRKDLTEGELDQLQKDTFSYFLKEANLENGLMPDNTRQDSPCSITAVGLGMSAHIVGVERGLMTRADAIKRTLTTLRFFWESEQSREKDATGYKGFYYHFLDMKTGRRAWKSELSTIDTTFFLAGALAAAQYFDRNTKEEKEIRTLADALYHRADWHWALNGGAKVSMGWKPESGFLPYRWEGYSEALLFCALGLGSPTFPLPEKSYKAFTE